MDGFRASVGTVTPVSTLIEPAHNLLWRAILVRTMVTDDWLARWPEAGPDDGARQLQRCPLFRGLGITQLHELLRSARMRRVSEREFYFRQGDLAAEAYVLMRGRVKLIRTGSDTRRGIVRFVPPLEPFGYEAALAGTSYAASAQASEDSEALAWSATTLANVMTSHPVIAHNCLRLMAETIQGTWERVHGLFAESLERRAARALLMLGARIGRRAESGTAITLRLPRQDLAAFVGATPYAMSRIVSRWRRLRIVDAGHGWVMIWPRRLAKIVGDSGAPRTHR